MGELRRFLEAKMRTEENLTVLLRENLLREGLVPKPLSVLTMDQLQDRINKAEALADSLKRYKFLRELYW